jgi:hypothetical protein
MKTLKRKHRPTRTTSPITTAFTALRKLGYFARQRFQCCQSCGWAAVPEEAAGKVVFYHQQDASRLKEGGDLYLAWSGSADEICSALEAQGLTVVKPANANSRIIVKNC